jgi:hypothetical protein
MRISFVICRCGIPRYSYCCESSCRPQRRGVFLRPYGGASKGSILRGFVKLGWLRSTSIQIFWILDQIYFLDKVSNTF